MLQCKAKSPNGRQEVSIWSRKGVEHAHLYDMDGSYNGVRCTTSKPIPLSVAYCLITAWQK